MTPEMARHLWSVVEKERREGETWMDACEREMYTAIVSEGYLQTKIAVYMSCLPVEVNRRMKRYGLRPRDRDKDKSAQRSPLVAVAR